MEQERRFTLRLTDFESRAIQELKPILRETTDSAIVRKAIVKYKKLYDDFEAEKRMRIQAESKLKDLENTMKLLYRAFETLNLDTENGEGNKR